MRYYAQVRGSSEYVPIDVEVLGENRFAVTLRGKRHEVDAVALEANALSLLLAGSAYQADLELRENDLEVKLRQNTVTLSLLDERRFQLHTSHPVKKAEGRQLVRSPMPGRVVKLLAQVGDEVREGQGVVVVEAMKMENELRAPKTGRVIETPVAEGATVESQAVLMAIE